MGKITVKHYLNKSQSKKVSQTDPKLPVYVQVTVKRQVNRKRSQIDELFCWDGPEYGLTQQELEAALIDRQNEWGRALALERKVIEDIINYLDPFSREDFTLANFTDIFHYATYTLFKLIEDAGKHYLELSMRERWADIYHIVDQRKPLLEILKGLEALGKGNAAFKQDVLNDKDLCTAKTALEHFYEYSKLISTGVENHSEFLKHTAFYWFTSNTSDNYISYLLQKGCIKSNQVPSLTAFFAKLGDVILFKIKSLSSSKR